EARAEHAPLPPGARDGRELAIDEGPPLLDEFRVARLEGASARLALAVLAVRAEARPLPGVARAAPEPGLVEEVPEGHRQELGEPGPEHVEEGRGAGAVTEAHEHVAELVRRPLGAMRGVEARHEEVVAEGLVLGLAEDPRLEAARLLDP